MGAVACEISHVYYQTLVLVSCICHKILRELYLRSQRRTKVRGQESQVRCGTWDPCKGASAALWVKIGAGTKSSLLRPMGS